MVTAGALAVQGTGDFVFGCQAGDVTEEVVFKGGRRNEDVKMVEGTCGGSAVWLECGATEAGVVRECRVDRGGQETRDKVTQAGTSAIRACRRGR